MKNFELKPLDQVSVEALWRLLSDPRLAKHMPLHDSSITQDWVEQWVQAKTSQWNHPAAGPWAIVAADDVIGWGGYQPDGDQVELALVLAPTAWGMGLDIVEEINQCWNDVGDSRPRLMYLPKSRRSELLAQRWNLEVLGETEVLGAQFTIVALDSAPRS